MGRANTVVRYDLNSTASSTGLAYGYTVADVSAAAPAAQRWRGVRFHNATVGWAVGDEGRVIHSRDGGTVWMPQTTTVTHHLLRVQVRVAPLHGQRVGGLSKPNRANRV